MCIGIKFPLITHGRPDISSPGTSHPRAKAGLISLILHAWLECAHPGSHAFLKPLALPLFGSIAWGSKTGFSSLFWYVDVQSADTSSVCCHNTRQDDFISTSPHLVMDILHDLTICFNSISGRKSLIFNCESALN